MNLNFSIFCDTQNKGPSEIIESVFKFTFRPRVLPHGPQRPEYRQHKQTTARKAVMPLGRSGHCRRVIGVDNIPIICICRLNTKCILTMTGVKHRRRGVRPTNQPAPFFTVCIDHQCKLLVHLRLLYSLRVSLTRPARHNRTRKTRPKHTAKPFVSSLILLPRITSPSSPPPLPSTSSAPRCPPHQASKAPSYQVDICCRHSAARSPFFPFPHPSLSPHSCAPFMVCIFSLLLPENSHHHFLSPLSFNSL